MPYADTDFFMALSDKNDRLNSGALAAYQKYKGTIYTSLAVIIELALISVRREQPVERLVTSTLTLADIKGVDKAKVMLAAHFIDKFNLTVFDAFHAALCDGEIISSDHVYDKIGISRIQI